jgi:hypothetical protein
VPGDLLKAPKKAVGGFQTPDLANGAGQFQTNLTLRCRAQVCRTVTLPRLRHDTPCLELITERLQGWCWYL